MDKQVLGVICARGGSKGFPGKNLAEVHGKPLIWYSIQQAAGAETLSRCLISTDSPEIANVARKYAPHWVQFLRPSELATDDSPIDLALLHALSFEETKGAVYDYVVLLPNSAPLRTPWDIDASVRILDANPEADSVFSAVEIEHPYELMDEDGSQPLQYQGIYRRQDCDPLYLGNGVVRAFRCDFLMRIGCIWGGKVLPYVMPQYRSVEIDSEEDLQYVAKMLTVSEYGK